MSGYTKLFSDIVDSSIWQEPAETCKVWVTLLAMCDQDGFVRGSVGWLASKAKVSVEACQKAIETFVSPDAQSRNPQNKGRRIEAVEFGWVVLNYRFFRDRMRQISSDNRRTYKREWMRAKRATLSTLSTESTTVHNDTQVYTGIHPASASASVTERGVGRESTSRFQKPSYEAAALYAAKIGISDAEVVRFMDYYEANGWKVGRNSMKSWQAAMRNWKNNIKNYGSKTNNSTRGQRRTDLNEGTISDGDYSDYSSVGKVKELPGFQDVQGGPTGDDAA